MSASFYLGPNKPRFAPTSWQEIVEAVDNGLLDEGHWVELKKTLPPKSPGANLELAKDLASLSIDGGVLIVGIEDRKGAAGAVTGTAVAGLASRIDATARARIEPPLTVVTTEFPHPADPDTAVLVVTVPASAIAPHMVDKSYWGRGDEGKRALSDHEVRRLLTIRHERTAGFETRLRRVAEDIGVPPADTHTAYLSFLAEPAATPLGPSVSDVLGQMHPLQWFLEAVPTQLQWAPTLQSLHHRIPHPDGFAARSFRSDATDDHPRLSVLIGDDGRWLARSGAPVSPVGSSVRDASDPLVFRAGAALELTHSLLAAIAHLATDKIPFQGQWTLGVHVSNLRGIEPVEQHMPPFFSDFSVYPRDEYLRVDTSTTDELADEPARVVERLLRPLLRSFSVDHLYLPYENIPDIGSRRPH